jgi:hypothetical protein
MSNPQPGGPEYPFWPGSSPFTCPVWDTLPVANTSGFWIWWLELLTLCCAISFNHSQLQQLTIHDCLSLAPFSFSLSLSLWLIPDLRLDYLYSREAVHRKHRFCCQECVFIGPLTSKGRPLLSRIVASITQQRAVYQESVSARTCLSSRCLAVGWYVTILCKD